MNWQKLFFFKRYGIFAPLVGLLWLLSWVYYFFYSLHKQFNWRKVRAQKAFVVSIGNIVAGGTGKTPFVQYLSNVLQEQNIAFAVVVRAYKAKKKIKTPVCVDLPDADRFGDEAVLHFLKYPGKVITGPSKAESVLYAESLGFPVIVVDDGFQHHRLHRDFDIVLIDAKNPFGSGLLPKGILRELPVSLKRADLIVITRVDQIEDEEPLIQLIRQYSSAPIMASKMQFLGFFKENEEVQLPEKTPVALFCGIANPEQFQNMIQRSNLAVCGMLAVRDHELPNVFTFSQFCEDMQAKGAQYLITTEKDYARGLISASIPILCARIVFQPVSQEKSIDSLVEKIQEKISV